MMRKRGASGRQQAVDPGHGQIDLHVLAADAAARPLARGKAIRRRAATLTMMALTVALLSACGQATPGPPDPRMIDLAVRATMHAMPSPTPRIIEVTRVVEVRVEVEVTRIVVPTATATLTPTPAPTLAQAPPALKVDAAPIAAAQQAAAARPPSAAPSAPACPASSDRQYTLIPIVGAPANHPDGQHGDLNLALRSYVPTEGELALTTINGPTAGDPPQLYHLFGDGRTPRFTALYRVHDWNWQCGDRGCRGGALDSASLVAMETGPSEPIFAPLRRAEIYGGDYRALVLFADADRITLGYTREDSVANGYAVHIEQICVDANLLARYREANANGRGSLPALRPGEPLGTASGTAIAVAIRDRGAFLDPRSRKDWWQGR